MGIQYKRMNGVEIFDHYVMLRDPDYDQLRDDKDRMVERKISCRISPEWSLDYQPLCSFYEIYIDIVMPEDDPPIWRNFDEIFTLGDGRNIEIDFVN